MAKKFDFDEDPRLEGIVQRSMAAFFEAESRVRAIMDELTDEELDDLDQQMRDHGTLGNFLAESALATKMFRAAGELIDLTGRGVSFPEVHAWIAKKGKS